MTDFGMAKLGNQNSGATQRTFTMCPGTDVYMPPEAVQDNPVYTEKIDCFSFGVITIQIITQEFPKPGDRRKKVQINQPGLPPIVEVSVPEIERRQSHICKIDLNHPLKQVALDCLKDRDVERPSAQQLRERVAALKEDPQYSESVRVVEARNSVDQDRSDERDREPRSLRRQHSQLVQELQLQLERKEQIITQKDEFIAEQRQQAQRLETEKERELRQKMDEIDRLERQLGRVNQQLEESEQANAQFQRRIAELEQLRSATDTSSSSKEQRASIKLTWREGRKAPREMSVPHNAALDGSTLYVRVVRQMYSYTISNSRWSQLPGCPTQCCPSVIINNLLTLVGGLDQTNTLINQLFSLTGKGRGRRWTEEFPPMPTKRYGSTALCTETAMIVAGGRNKDGSLLQAIEVMNTETLQWSTAADLPKPLLCAQVSVCGVQVYISGRANMYTCSMLTLIQSCKSFLAGIRNRGARVWREVAAPRVEETTYVTVHGRLLTVGGKGTDQKSTTAVHMYNSTTDSWEVISHMETPRYACITAVLPNNQLMVVGGYTGTGGEKITDSVEFASIE